MKDLSHLAKGVSDSLADDQFGDVSGGHDVDPDGGSSFESMDGDASYPHNTSPSNIGHSYFKNARGDDNG